VVAAGLERVYLRSKADSAAVIGKAEIETAKSPTAAKSAFVTFIVKYGAVNFKKLEM
jgi:hypothetical protein